MNNPLVSINIPVFKCEKHILKCLESVKYQTYQNFEIILVNDCTPDTSISIIDEFIQQNPNLTIHLVHLPENRGLSVVRNTGIDLSKGKYIFFLDSDDEISEDCIEKLVQNILLNKTEIVIGQNKWINTFNNTVKNYGFPTQSSKKVYTNNEEIFKAYCNDSFPITSWNKLILRDFIIKNKIYFIEGLYGQDELWMFHLMEKINSLSIIEDITYNYYLHSESVIFNRTKKNFENYMLILSYFKTSYDKSNSTRKKYIKKKIIKFKDMVMVMQWRAMKGDKSYFIKNYSRMKILPSLNFAEYFSTFYPLKVKKMNILQNLPSSIGVYIFIKRWG